MAVTATQGVASNNAPIYGGPIPGLGWQVIVAVEHSGTYSTGGDTLDLSDIFPTEVYGGHPTEDSTDDGGWKSTYVLAAAGAPATGLLQMYYVDANNAADAPFVEVANGVALTDIDSQCWVFWGR